MLAMKSPSTRRRRGRSPSADERLDRLAGTHTAKNVPLHKKIEQMALQARREHRMRNDRVRPGPGRPDLASGNGATVPGALTGNAGGKSIFSPMGTQNAAAGSPGMSPGFGGTTTAAAGGTSPSSYGRASSANLWATSRPASQARNSPEADMTKRTARSHVSMPSLVAQEEVRVDVQGIRLAEAADRMKAARAAFNRAKHDADALAARCKRAEDHLREIEMEDDVSEQRAEAVEHIAVKKTELATHRAAYAGALQYRRTLEHMRQRLRREQLTFDTTLKAYENLLGVREKQVHDALNQVDRVRRARDAEIIELRRLRRQFQRDREAAERKLETRKQVMEEKSEARAYQEEQLKQEVAERERLAAEISDAERKKYLALHGIQSFRGNVTASQQEKAVKKVAAWHRHTVALRGAVGLPVPSSGVGSDGLLGSEPEPPDPAVVIAKHQEMSGEADALNDQVQQLHARISRLRREQRALQRRLVVARTNGPAAAIAMGDSGSPELGGKRPNTTGSSMPDRPQTVNNITRRASVAFNRERLDELEARGKHASRQLAGARQEHDRLRSILLQVTQSINSLAGKLEHIPAAAMRRYRPVGSDSLEAQRLHGVAARLVFIRKALVDAANPEDGDGSSGKRGRNGGKASRHRRKSNLSNASDASFGGGLSPGRGSDGSVEDTPLGYGNFAMMDTLAGLVGANPLNVRVPSAAAASAANGMGAAGGAGGATPMAGAVGDRSRSAAMPSGVPQPPPSFTVTPLSITTNLTSMTPVPGSRLFVPTARPARARPVGTPLSDVTGRAGSTRSFGDKRSVASGSQFRSRTPIMGSAADDEGDANSLATAALGATGTGSVAGSSVAYDQSAAEMPPPTATAPSEGRGAIGDALAELTVQDMRLAAIGAAQNARAAGGGFGVYAAGGTASMAFTTSSTSDDKDSSKAGGDHEVVPTRDMVKHKANIMVARARRSGGDGRERDSRRMRG